MSLASRFFGLRWKLPAPITRDIATEPLRIPMRDGVELLADRCYPRHAAKTPTVLIRSCYGRSVFKFIAHVFAERGMQVVMQSCRGTSGSQGTFRPFFDELSDGEDTVEWIERQPWFSGRLALWGMSYLGNTAWAIAGSRAAPKIDALGLHVTLTNFRDETYAFDGFSLMTGVGWTRIMVEIVRAGAGGLNLFLALLGRWRLKALLERAAATIPLRKADRILAPEGVFWWQDWMDHAEPGDPWWNPIDYGAAARTLPPTSMVGGWYDIFLPFQLRDFAAAQNAGRDVRITIGPWTHGGGFDETLRQSITLFQERFGILPQETAGANGKPRVRLFLMGADEWREYPSWPPPNTAPRAFYLHPSGGLSTAAPTSESESTFDYDPARPTPALHGPELEAQKGSGDMAELERRSDVLVFTTEPVASDVDAIGPVSAGIFLRSNTGHTDLYLCLCDVTPAGRSSNVCDGYRRLRPDGPPGQARKVDIEFWPTAYRFRRGHRLRIIVASGAHPRYSRNPGSGEPLGDATSMVVAHQRILHGPEHPSAITLAVASS